MSPFAKMVIYPSIALLVAFGWHFMTVFGWLGSAPDTKGELFTRIGIFFVIFMVLATVIGVLIARQHERDATPDEREELIALKAERAGIPVIYLGLLVVAWFAFKPLTPMQVANAILVVVWLAELVKVIYAITVLKRTA